MKSKHLLSGLSLLCVLAFTAACDGDSDSKPPRVLSTIPASNAADVARNAKVIATFDQALDPRSVTPDTVEVVDVANGE